VSQFAAREAAGQQVVSDDLTIVGMQSFWDPETPATREVHPDGNHAGDGLRWSAANGSTGLRHLQSCGVRSNKRQNSAWPLNSVRGLPPATGFHLQGSAARFASGNPDLQIDSRQRHH